MTVVHSASQCVRNADGLLLCEEPSLIEAIVDLALRIAQEDSTAQALASACSIQQLQARADAVKCADSFQRLIDALSANAPPGQHDVPVAPPQPSALPSGASRLGSGNCGAWNQRPQLRSQAGHAMLRASGLSPEYNNEVHGPDARACSVQQSSAVTPASTQSSFEQSKQVAPQQLPQRWSGHTMTPGLAVTPSLQGRGANETVSPAHSRVEESGTPLAAMPSSGSMLFAATSRHSCNLKVQILMPRA